MEAYALSPPAAAWSLARYKQVKSVSEYCQILGIDTQATPEDLKQAYRKQVKEWHPDRFLHNPRLQKKAQEKLRDINEAYDKLQTILSNSSSLSQASKESIHPRQDKVRRSTAFSVWSANPHFRPSRNNWPFLSRAILEAAKDPWIIAVLILMLIAAAVIDWFYSLT